jgi:hypothetical protein
MLKKKKAKVFFLYNGKCIMKWGRRNAIMKLKVVPLSVGKCVMRSRMGTHAVI